jgi:hypothetical protein
MARISVLCVLLLFSGMALGQTVVRGYVPCVYGCGPFVPLVTTPMVSLQTAAPSSVGATNATGGLEAGARNSTLSTFSGSPDAVYTQPVWYSGATAPVLGPAVSLVPIPAVLPEEVEHNHPAARSSQYFSALEETANVAESASSAKSGKPAARTVTNQDVDRFNQQTGTVKYKGKTERIN